MTILTSRELYEAFENDNDDVYLTEEDMLIDIYNVLVENYEFESEEEVFATIELLEDESLEELVAFIYEGYEPSEYFFEDLEESYQATEEYLLNEGVLSKLGDLSVRAGNRVGKFLQNANRRGPKRNLNLLKRRAKRALAIGPKYDAMQDFIQQKKIDTKIENSFSPPTTPDQKRIADERERKNKVDRFRNYKQRLKRIKND